MLEGRAALGQVAVGEYRDGSSMGLLGLVLDSKNFDGLLRNMEYVTQIMSYQADEVAEPRGQAHRSARRTTVRGRYPVSRAASSAALRST